MNEAILKAWRETVGDADTIICGGDIALAGALKGELLARVRAMPGRKLLVRGNHDIDRKGRAADTACGETWRSLVITGGPPLLVTHMPMTEVPDGTVNVHGHVHNNEPLRGGPYVNICVEHTGYRPLPLDAVRRLARARLDDPAAAGGDDGRGDQVLERGPEDAQAMTEGNLPVPGDRPGRTG